MKSNDGIDHIRIDLDAATELGRKLSEFYPRKFGTRKHGEFAHLLGYSLYLRTGCKLEQLRYLPPNRCIALAKGKKVWNPSFETDYYTGLEASLQADPELVTMLKDSELRLIVYKKAVGDVKGYRNLIDGYYNHRRNVLRLLDLPTMV